MKDLIELTKHFKSEELHNLLKIGIHSKADLDYLLKLMEELLPKYYKEESLEYQTLINILNKITIKKEITLQ